MASVSAGIYQLHAGRNHRYDETFEYRVMRASGSIWDCKGSRRAAQWRNCNSHSQQAQSQRRSRLVELAMLCIGELTFRSLKWLGSL